MKAPPETWTPEMADRARAYVADNPDDREFVDALKQYDALSAAGANQSTAPYDIPDDVAVRGMEVRQRLASLPNEYAPPDEGGVAGFMSLLPKAFGGKSDTFVEPTMGEFEGLIGDAALSPEEKQQAFAAYKDARWEQALQKAQAEGTRIRRRKDPTAQAYIREGLGLQRMADTGSFGLVKHGLRGLSSATGFEAPARAADSMDEGAAQMSTGEKLQADIATAFVPGAPAARIGKTADTLLKVGKSSGAISGLVRGGTAAVVGAAAGGAAADMAPVLSGEDAPPLDEMGQRALSRAPLAGLLGGLAGAGVGAYRGLRTEGAAGGIPLRTIEEAGGGTSVLGGVRPPQAVADALEASRVPGTSATNKYAADILGEGSQAGAATEISSKVQQTLTPLREANAQYYKSPEGLARVPAQNTLQTAVSLLSKRRLGAEQAVGGAPTDLLMVNNKPLVDTVRQLAGPIKAGNLVSNAAAPAAAQAGRTVVPLQEALDKGLVTLDDLRGAGMPVDAPPMPPGSVHIRDLKPNPNPMRETSTAWMSENMSPEALAKMPVRIEEYVADGVRVLGDGRHRVEWAAKQGLTSVPALKVTYDANGVPSPPRPTTLVIGDAPPPVNLAEYSLALDAQPMNAQQLDDVVRPLTDLSKVLKNNPNPDPAYKELLIASYRDRGNFKGNQFTPQEPVKLDDETVVHGWAALKRKEHQAMSALEGDLSKVGVRSLDTSKQDMAQSPELLAALKGYRGPGRGQTDDALMRLTAGDPQLQQQIRELAAAREFPRFLGRASGLESSGLGVVGRGLNIARFHLDPVAQAVGQPLNAGQRGQHLGLAGLLGLQSGPAVLDAAGVQEQKAKAAMRAEAVQLLKAAMPPPKENQ